MFKAVANFTSALKPKPRSGATLVHVEDRIILVGGRDISSNLLEELDCNLLTGAHPRPSEKIIYF